MQIKRHIATAALLAGLAATPALAASPHAWQPIKLSGLQVTDGTVTAAGKYTMRTRSAGMRAEHRDGGRHAARARLWFRLRGESETTAPLGSGIVRRQIGLKLRSSNPCNLVYVMWRSYPERVISILVKRNPGQTTSSQCGNRGYTDVATIPLTRPAALSDARAHTLEARTRRSADGSLALTVYTDGALFRRQRLSAALTAGLDGPIGVRSDNGDYSFRLSAADRPPA